MIDAAWCRAMAAYNRWMNEKFRAGRVQPPWAVCEDTTAALSSTRTVRAIGRATAVRRLM